MSKRTVCVCLDTLIVLSCAEDATDSEIYTMAQEKLTRWAALGLLDTLEYEIVDEFESDKED